MTYRDKVYKLLIELTDEFNINEKVKPENKDEFIEIVKEFIRFDMSRDFIIEFNNSYTKIKKISK